MHHPGIFLGAATAATIEAGQSPEESQCREWIRFALVAIISRVKFFAHDICTAHVTCHHDAWSLHERAASHLPSSGSATYSRCPKREQPQDVDRRWPQPL